MKHAVGAMALLVCAGSVISGQTSNPVRLSFVTYAAQSANPAAGPSALDAVVGYRDLGPQLQSKTKVPLRLPTFVPYSDDKNNPVFASLVPATSDNYQLELAWAPDCNGAGACHLGTISGSASSLPENKGPKIPVVLNGGVQGYFIDAVCGANCDDSAIYWTDGSYHYSIRMKAETKDTLTKMVNSAIDASPK
jgi:hypothetical protein